MISEEEKATDKLGFLQGAKVKRLIAGFLLFLFSMNMLPGQSSESAEHERSMGKAGFKIRNVQKEGLDWKCFLAVRCIRREERSPKRRGGNSSAQELKTD